LTKLREEKFTERLKEHGEREKEIDKRREKERRG